MAQLKPNADLDGTKSKLEKVLDPNVPKSGQLLVNSNLPNIFFTFSQFNQKKKSSRSTKIERWKRQRTCGSVLYYCHGKATRPHSGS